MSDTPVVAILGFGELGSVLATGLTDAGVAVQAWSRARPDAASAQRLTERINAAGARACGSMAEAVGGASTVIVGVPVSAASHVVAACAPLLDRGATYVDLAPAGPTDKLAAADLVGRHGGRYVDAAMLGTVTVEGFGAPILASGPGAPALAQLGRATGMNVTAISGAAGRATLVKLLRSLYTKGRSMLMLEMLAAARRNGVDSTELLETFTGPSESVPFPDLVQRMICGLPVHAGRWADELAGAVEVLAESDAQLAVAAASAEELRRVDATGLGDRFGGQRAARVDEVVSSLSDEALGSGGGPSARSG